VNGREHAGGPRVWDLDVEHRAVRRGQQRLLHQRGLADAPSAGDADEKPAPAAQDAAEPMHLLASAVESPTHLCLGSEKDFCLRRHFLQDLEDKAFI
jgi:hypothetical protein